MILTRLNLKRCLNLKKNFRLNFFFFFRTEVNEVFTSMFSLFFSSFFFRDRRIRNQKEIKEKKEKTRERVIVIKIATFASTTRMKEFFMTMFFREFIKYDFDDCV